MNTNLRIGVIFIGGSSRRRRARRLHDPGGHDGDRRRRRGDRRQRDRRHRRDRRHGTGGAAGGGYATSPGVACLPPASGDSSPTSRYVPGDAAVPATDPGALRRRFHDPLGRREHYANASGVQLTSDVTGRRLAHHGTRRRLLRLLPLLRRHPRSDGMPATGRRLGLQRDLLHHLGDSAGNQHDHLRGRDRGRHGRLPAWLDSVDAGTARRPTPGSLHPGGSATTQYYHPGCADPTYPIAVTVTQARPQTGDRHWTDFTDGHVQAERRSRPDHRRHLLAVTPAVGADGVTPYAARHPHRQPHVHLRNDARVAPRRLTACADGSPSSLWGRRAVSVRPVRRPGARAPATAGGRD